MTRLLRSPFGSAGRWSLAFILFALPAHFSAGRIPTPHPLRSAPGEVIVKFKPGLAASARDLLAKHASFAAALEDGSASLDELNRRHGVRGARRVFSHLESPSAAGALGAQERSRKDVARRFPRRAARAPRGSAPAPDLTNVYVLKVPEDADVEAVARDYAADPHVEYAQPNYVYRVASSARAAWTPNDPYFSSTNSWGFGYADLWGLQHIHASEAWDVTRGQGITVAVVDTGVDSTHPDISANLVAGWNFVASSSDTMDENGHGTHVAGTIAAVGNNGIGIVGVAPEARIMPLKGFNAKGLGYAGDLAAAMVYASDHGADVVNNSWACGNPGCGSDPVVEDAVRTLYAAGVVTVFGAGNDSLDVVGYSPQNMTEAKPIVVGASNEIDDTRTEFSNHGILIDVVAPGADILSLRSSVCDEAICDRLLLVGDRYLRLTGTSMATPHVSGVAALVLSHNPSLTNEDVRQVLRLSADDVGTTGFDRANGAGLANAARAVAIGSVARAAITSPSLFAAYAPVRGAVVEVRGSAGGSGFASYQLFYSRPTDPVTWLPLLEPSPTAVENGTLGRFEVGDLPTGLYGLRLVTTSTSGTTTEAFSQFAVEQNLLLLSVPPAYDVFPSVSGNRIVWTHVRDYAPWQRYTDGGFHSLEGDLYVYDLTTRTRRVIASNATFGPQISGDFIVWLDVRLGPGAGNALYMYDVRTGTETPIANEPGFRRFAPAVSGHRVVWLETSDLPGDDSFTVNLYDAATGSKRRISSEAARPRLSDQVSDVTISGDRVLWYDVRNSPFGEIYLYDIATGAERPLLPAGSHFQGGTPVHVDGDRVVWIESNFDATSSLVIYDVRSGAAKIHRISPDSLELPIAYGFRPRISGDLVVWTDHRHDSWNGDVYLYDMATDTEQRITAQALDQSHANISEGHVVWMDQRENSHVYLYDLGTTRHRPAPREVLPR